MRAQLAVLNRQVGTRLSLKNLDLDCLDLINLHGPMSPSQLADRADVHPATITGILDRLERGGWIVRERPGTDRRAVLVKALRTRTGEVYGLLAPMNQALEEICEAYSDDQLQLIAEFLLRVTDAGREAAPDATRPAAG
jgi:DNA-binding MarR family transcriptional regulator